MTALTNLDRVLYPQAGFTKGDLVAYYTRIAPAILGHLRGRPLTLGRFPRGVDAPGFAQTECRGRPDWMATIAVKLRDGRVREQCVADGPEALAWIANQSAIELHVPHPDAVVFDLDPGPGAGMTDCRRVALRLRDLLAALGLRAYAKTSGSLGLHVHVPLNAPHAPGAAKQFARATAERLAAEDPERVIARAHRAQRTGRVLVDWLSNESSRTLIAPYSLRAADWPAVSTPVTWEEVERTDDLTFLAPDVLRRIERLGDPFAPVLEERQRLPLAR